MLRLSRFSSYSKSRNSYRHHSTKSKPEKTQRFIFSASLIVFLTVISRDKFLQVLGRFFGFDAEELSFRNNELNVSNLKVKTDDRLRFFKVDIFVEELRLVLGERFLMHFLDNKFWTKIDKEMIIEKIEVRGMKGNVEFCETDPDKVVLPILVKEICVLDSQLEFVDSRVIKKGKMIDKHRKVEFPLITVDSLSTSNYVHKDKPKQVLEKMIFVTNGYGSIGEDSWIIRNSYSKDNPEELVQCEYQISNLPLQTFARYLSYPASEVKALLDINFYASRSGDIMKSESSISLHDMSMDDMSKDPELKKNSFTSQMAHLAAAVSIDFLKNKTYNVKFSSSFKQGEFDEKVYFTHAFAVMVQNMRQSKLFSKKKEDMNLQESEWVNELD